MDDPIYQNVARMARLREELADLAVSCARRAAEDGMPADEFSALYERLTVAVYNVVDGQPMLATTSFLASLMQCVIEKVENAEILHFVNEHGRKDLDEPT